MCGFTSAIANTTTLKTGKVFLIKYPHLIHFNLIIMYQSKALFIHHLFIGLAFRMHCKSPLFPLSISPHYSSFHFWFFNRSCVVVNASDTQSDNPSSILGRDSLANQAVHPSGVAELVAINKQLCDHCRISRSVKRADRKTTGVKTRLPHVGFLRFRTGDLSSYIIWLKAPNMLCWSTD